MSGAIEYHAYVIGADGLIITRVELFCADDQAARRQAAQLVDGHDIELWRGANRLATFAAKE